MINQIFLLMFHTNISQKVLILFLLMFLISKLRENKTIFDTKNFTFSPFNIKQEQDFQIDNKKIV